MRRIVFQGTDLYGETIKSSHCIQFAHRVMLEQKGNYIEVAKDSLTSSIKE